MSVIASLLIIFVFVSPSIGQMTDPLTQTGVFHTQQLTIQIKTNILRIKDYATDMIVETMTATLATGTSTTSTTSTAYPGNLSHTISLPFNGWTFSKNTDLIPSYYVALSIESLQMQVQNNWLMFNILSQQISKTGIKLNIKFCQTNSACFTSTTLRILAVDYDRMIDGQTTQYTQIMNGFFIQTILVDSQNQRFLYNLNTNTSALSNVKSFSYLIFIRSINLKEDKIGGSNNFIMSAYSISLSLTTSDFTLSIKNVKDQNSFNITFDIIFYDQKKIQSQRRYFIGHYVISTITKTQNLTHSLQSRDRTQICGDGIIQDSEACDDGNTQNMDGCDNKCKVQDGFECRNITRSKSSNYFNSLFSQCIYVKEIQMIKTYLQKIPYQNKVVFRFNFYPNLAVFNKKTFYSVISSTFTSNWTGIDQTSLQAKRVEGGQFQNGLFVISFSYNEEWTDNITLKFSPSETKMKPFSSIQSRLLFSENNVRHPIFGHRPIATQRLLVQTSTPSSMVALPSKSDNNLMMFSQSYDVYSICQYFSYLLVSVMWIFWMTGLFYGKSIVVEFVLVIQIILLCVMSTGILTPGFSGLMLESFVFFCFTGFLSDSYQTRPIYDISSPELKSANISIHPLQNLSLYLIILTIILLIGIIARLMQKRSKQYSLVIEKVGQYAFGQFMLYALMPFLLNGNLTTFYYIKSLVLGRNIQILDVLTLLVFHASAIFLVVFSVKNPLLFGQFKTSFLRYDISQHYFLIVTILMTFLGFYYPIMFEYNLDKFSAILPLLIFGFAVAANIIKRPFLDEKHLCRTLSLYLIGVLAVITAIAYNFLQQVQILQKYGAIIIIGLQTVLILLTGYFLITFIKNQGKLKFYAFTKAVQQNNTMNINIQEQYIKYQRPKMSIHHTMMNYYQKQSKLLQNIRNNSLLNSETIDYNKQYNNLQSILPIYQENEQKNELKKNEQKNEQVQRNDSKFQTKKDILKNIKQLKTCFNFNPINQEKQDDKNSIQQDTSDKNNNDFSDQLISNYAGAFFKKTKKTKEPSNIYKPSDIDMENEFLQQQSIGDISIKEQHKLNKPKGKLTSRITQSETIQPQRIYHTIH